MFWEPVSCICGVIKVRGQTQAVVSGVFASPSGTYCGDKGPDLISCVYQESAGQPALPLVL